MKEYDHYRIIDNRSGQSCGTFKYTKDAEVPEEILNKEKVKAREKKNAAFDVLTIEKYKPGKRRFIR